jgi:hypothetical protein
MVGEAPNLLNSATLSLEHVHTTTSSSRNVSMFF